MLVLARRLNLVAEAGSASEGSVGQREVDARPLLRSGDLLEFVPGVVATQHSGNGKANQYFLRGFNLDNGTDFATFVDAMPVNAPTHGHGQGQPVRCFSPGFKILKFALYAPARPGFPALRTGKAQSS